MFCPQCYHELNDSDQFCYYCGAKIELPIQHCPNCGHEIHKQDHNCSHCGYQLPLQRTKVVYPKRKIVAIILGLILGGLGIHNFYLGYSSKGFFQIVLFFVGLLTFGATTFLAIIWGLIDVCALLLGIINRDGDDHLLI